RFPALVRHLLLLGWSMVAGAGSYAAPCSIVKTVFQLSEHSPPAAGRRESSPALRGLPGRARGCSATDARARGPPLRHGRCGLPAARRSAHGGGTGRTAGSPASPAAPSATGG